MELAPGAVVAGRYRLDRRVGEGGMGVVWAATELAGGGRVALKHLRAEAASDPDVRRRFLREARTAAKVVHPNVVPIRQVIETEEGAPILVMDLLEGESLAARLSRRGRLPLGEAAAILVPVLRAVAAAHALGVVHRDLKPDNVFLASGDGGRVEIKVLDFGIAKLTAEAVEGVATAALTRTGLVLGTPYYMSPEQFLGDKDIDLRTDVWSLGVLLYECLSGVRPTEAETAGKIFQIILTGSFRPLAELVPELPAELGALARRMLARERAERPAVAEVEAALAPHADGEVTPDADADAGAQAAAELAVRGEAATVAIGAPGGGPAEPPDGGGVLASTAPTGVATAPAEAATAPAEAAPRARTPLRRGAATLFFAGIAVLAALAAGGAAWRFGARRGAQSPLPAPPAGRSVSLPSGSPECPPRMARIPGGVFAMGSEDGTQDERPVHQVEVRSYCLDLTEVTVGQYARCADTGPCAPVAITVTWAEISGEDKQFQSAFCQGYQDSRGDHPINCVDWNQADAYCRAADKRLPTEEEWEFAARGGPELRRFPWGDGTFDATRANVCDAACRDLIRGRGRDTETVFEQSDGFGVTAPVGSFPAGASRDGVLDLLGNVWEWTASPFCTYPEHHCPSPTRVFRGAGWWSTRRLSVRPTTRLFSMPAFRFADIGFRCAADLRGAAGGSSGAN